jgi:hypothetical protein
MQRRGRWGRGVSLALVALGLFGCAAGQTAGLPAPDPDLLTAAELGGASEASVFEAVKRLRPRFLQSRGPNSLSLASAGGPAVWVDGTLMGGVEWLGWLHPREVVTIRRLGAWDAATAYGAGFPDGVLVVTTRPGRAAGD